MQQELDVYRVNPYGTSVGHQDHISQTHSSCGPHDSPFQTIEVVKTFVRRWLTSVKALISHHLTGILQSCSPLTGIHVHCNCRVARVAHRRYGWSRSQPAVTLEHCKLGTTSYLVTKSLLSGMKPLSKEENPLEVKSLVGRPIISKWCA